MKDSWIYKKCICNPWFWVIFVLLIIWSIVSVTLWEEHPVWVALLIGLISATVSSIFIGGMVATAVDGGSGYDDYGY